MAESKNFKSEELACSCCGDEQVQQWALDKLQAIRDEAGRPLKITSAYRCINHPVEARKKKGGTHNQGIAFDIYYANGAHMHQLLRLAVLSGATGVGIAKNFIHVDWSKDRTAGWTY
jgi:zinc D-Ala-D-Ala carboxypeptidase